jgi:hypothetical protein
MLSRYADTDDIDVGELTAAGVGELRTPPDVRVLPPRSLMARRPGTGPFPVPGAARLS